MSEYLGERTPYSIQQFIYRGRYSADGLRDELRGYVSENLGEDDGTMVVDETGFLKQGKHSCGVKRQYSGLVAFALQTLLAHATGNGGAGRKLSNRRIFNIYKPKGIQSDRQEAVHAAGVDR